MTQTVRITLPKLRNRFAVAGRQRLAGAHRRPSSGLRQMAERALRAELKHSP